MDIEVHAVGYSQAIREGSLPLSSEVGILNLRHMYWHASGIVLIKLINIILYLKVEINSIDHVLI